MENLPDQLILEKDTIQVYCVNLDDKLWDNNLSEDELIRANKFKFDHLKNRFMICRSLLRKLLGKYLNIKPSEIVFKYSEKGKPSLTENCNPLEVDFNVSHSENFALYGFTIQRKIGVDIEQNREIENLDQLARRFFHIREYELISNLKYPEKQQLFYQIWTAKEAYLKAIGAGISGGLKTIEIDNFQLKINNKSLDNWQLYKLEINPKFTASLVVESNSKLPLKLMTSVSA